MLKFILQIPRCKKFCAWWQEENRGTVSVITRLIQPHTKTFEGKGVSSLLWASEHGNLSFGTDPLGKPVGTSVRMENRARPRIINGSGPLIQTFSTDFIRLLSGGVCAIFIKLPTQTGYPYHNSAWIISKKLSDKLDSVTTVSCCCLSCILWQKFKGGGELVVQFPAC